MAFDAALRYLIENVDLLKHVETFMRNCFRFYLLIRWLRGEGKRKDYAEIKIVERERERDHKKKK